MSVQRHHRPHRAGLQVDLNRAAPALSHWQRIDELREQHRYFWNEEGQGYWVLTRYEDIREAFQTPEVFCNHSIVPPNPTRSTGSCRRSPTRRSTWSTAAR